MLYVFEEQCYGYVDNQRGGQDGLFLGSFLQECRPVRIIKRIKKIRAKIEAFCPSHALVGELSPIGGNLSRIYFSRSSISSGGTVCTSPLERLVDSLEHMHTRILLVGTEVDLVAELTQNFCSHLSPFKFYNWIPVTVSHEDGCVLIWFVRRHEFLDGVMHQQVAR